MSTTYDDIARDMALECLHEEAKYERAKKEQCIFLFVEGNSEEIAFPILLAGLIDLTDLGVVIANYNGIGNLNAMLKFLSLTLSHNRPVIVTYDNDMEGIMAIRKYENSQYHSDIIKTFSIPQMNIVNYSNGHSGGSFEESFLLTDFFDCSFKQNILPTEIIEKKDTFIKLFNPQKPWMEQLKKFCALNGFKGWNINKPLIAREISMCCKEIPITYILLSILIKEVRTTNPIIHPYDVDLPNVRGLTC